jgi:hypothetical protein
MACIAKPKRRPSKIAAENQQSRAKKNARIAAGIILQATLAFKNHCFK